VLLYLYALLEVIGVISLMRVTLVGHVVEMAENKTEILFGGPEEK
jgi:hypothetical protein